MSGSSPLEPIVSEPPLPPASMPRPSLPEKAVSEMAVPQIIVNYSESTLLDTAVDATAQLIPSITPGLPAPPKRGDTPSDNHDKKAALRSPSGAATLRPSRPVLQRYYSLPTAPTLSPARQHFRLQNAEPRMVKETPSLAYTEDARGKFVNQYLVRRVVGHGSFGLVYEAVDVRTNTAFAIKEYSKTRLLKLNRKVMMQMRRQGRSSAAQWTPATAGGLIRGEVAIMKRIDHPNLVSLHEVIDDQRSDKLYMVIEWCEQGTVMPAESHYDGKATPLAEEKCRLYFRDMILGVEYLHAQGITHRDIKADNILLSDEDVIKIADFGVSEMFDAPENDSVKRCVGSPAYMSPELAMLSGAPKPEGEQNTPAPSAAEISGRKTDIWAMGVTLFYMNQGRLPFEASSLSCLYKAIIKDDFTITAPCSPALRDLYERILCKDAQARISMDELRNHPWVTHYGSDELLTREENVGALADPITEDDLNSAVESLQQRFSQQGLDWYNLAKRLQAGHGLRAPTLKSRTPTDPSHSPSLSSDGDSPPTEAEIRAPFHPGHRSSDSFSKMEKLSLALDEIMRTHGQESWSEAAAN